MEYQAKVFRVRRGQKLDGQNNTTDDLLLDIHVVPLVRRLLYKHFCCFLASEIRQNVGNMDLFVKAKHKNESK